MCLCCFYFLLLSNTQCWINICWSFAQSSSEVIHLFMLSQTVVMVPWLQTSREMTLLWDQLRQGAAMQISLTKDNVQACISAAKAKGSPASLQLPHVHCFHTAFIDFFFCVICWISCSLRYCGSLEASTVQCLYLVLHHLRPLMSFCSSNCSLSVQLTSLSPLTTGYPWMKLPHYCYSAF